MQGELFNFKGVGPAVDTSRVSQPQPNWLDQFRVTLRVDHLSILAISALVLYVLVFSFGVEKGKRIAIRELEAERVKQEQMSQDLAATQISEKAPSSTPESRPTPPVEEPESLSTPRAGKYTIQVITYTSQTRAEEEIKRFKDLGYHGFVIPAGRFFQVCVEAFEKMSEARERLIKLKAEGFAPSDAYIRPLQGQIPI